MADGVIELGVLGAPVPRASRPAVRRRPARPVLAGVLLTLLLGLVGSAPQRPGLGTPAWTAAAGSYGFVWGVESLQFIEPGARAVAARDAATGRLRWRLPLDRPPEQVFEVGRGMLGVVVAADQGEQDGSRSPDVDVLLIEEHSGRLVATVSGQPWRTGDDGTLLVARDEVGCTMSVCVTITAVHATTGTAGASATFDVQELDVAQARGAIAAIRPTSVEIRSSSDLHLLRRLDLPDPGVHDRRSALVGDRLVTLDRRQGGLIVTGYAWATPARTWSLVLSQPGDVTQSYLFPDACGDLLCAHLGASMAIIDPRTGELRSQLPDDMFVVPDEMAHLDEVMLGLSGPVPEAARVDVFVLSRADGAVLRRFAGTEVVPWWDSGHRGLLAREGHDRTEFMTVYGLGRVDLLGSVAGNQLGCAARGPMLACQGQGRLRVWRLPDDARADSRLP